MNESKNPLVPVGGYLVDILDKIRNRPFIPHSLQKLHNLKLVRDMTGARTVIEIGTFKGVTAKRLSRIFDTVATIEVVPELYEIAKKRCAGRSNVKLYLGDGALLLPEILQQHDKCVLFLDGHFSGGMTSFGEEPEPALHELDTLKAHIDRVSGFVIDDFRTFGVDEGFPFKWEVMRKIEENFPHPQWTHFVHNDQFLVVRANAA